MGHGKECVKYVILSVYGVCVWSGGGMGGGVSCVVIHMLSINVQLYTQYKNVFTAILMLGIHKFTNVLKYGRLSVFTIKYTEKKVYLLC